MPIAALKQSLARADLLLGSGRRRAWIAGGAAALALLFALGNASWKLGSGVSTAVCLPLAAVTVTVALRCAGVRWASVGLILAGLGVYVFYLSHTPYDLRNYDAPAHLKYVEHVLRHRALPAEGDCSICHHPPAWHILAAMVYGACEATGVVAPTKGLQLLSLVLWLCFLAMSALAIQRLLSRTYQQTLAMAFVVFWPYSIINSVRVNNDALMYALSAAVIHLLVRWYQQPRRRWMLAACACVVAALLTKASALSLVALVGVVLAMRVARSSGRRALLRECLPIVGGLLVVVAVFGTVRASRGKDLVRGTLGAAWRTQGIDMAERTARYYLTFDLPAQVRKPYADVGIGIREPTYWNHLFKSSLYGTGQGSGPVGVMVPSVKIARILNYLLPALTVVMAVGCALGRRDPRRRRLLCVAIAASFLTAGLAFHLMVPVSHHADFRFVMPVLLACSVLYAYAVEALRRRFAPSAILAALLAAGFLTLSVASFLWMSPRPQEPAPGSGMGLRPPLLFLLPKKSMELPPASSGR
ncbi:MAG: glycosyltransferase family 39 protein [Deltaproteobacteria bacterium]|nr:glycosyltransferase family 39 protein [Deltaproteobacteria bacterium]